MKNVRLALYSSLICGITILTAYTSQQKGNAEPKGISLEKYNAINYSIDSLENALRNTQNENNRAGSEIARYKELKTDLTVECEAIKRNLKFDTVKPTFDSLERVGTKCDSLPERIKNYDKKIADLDSKLNNGNVAVKTLKAGLEAQKELLQSEIKALNKIAKNISGSISIKFKGVNYNIFVTNLDSNEIRMHLLDKSGRNFASIRNLHSYLLSQKQTPLMITNGGMYMPNLQPQGLLIAQKELHPIDLKSPKTDANFYLKPNGIFYVDSFGKSHIEVSEEFQKLYENKGIAEYATQSGPMLVINGEIHKSFTPNSSNRKIRSGVGIIDGKKTVFAISLDETNFYDFALLFRDVFGCKNALFLDGAISLMYLKDIAPNVLGGQFGPLISVTPKSIAPSNKNE